jgi:Protein of unknown function (DUF3460)
MQRTFAQHRLRNLSFKENTMGLFRRPNYESDATEFIHQLKAQHPELDAQQRQGRALLWDKQVDREAQAEFKAARVAQKPYVYQTQA